MASTRCSVNLVFVCVFLFINTCVARSKPHLNASESPNFIQMASKNGYSAQGHRVITEDGYIIKIFNMLKGKNCKGQIKKIPLLLVHGVLQSSDVWLDAGPDSGLAYILSDACYDVWIGNVRGNCYSRRHTSLNPDRDSEFWNFSVDEIGYYDTLAMIDYIIGHTGSNKVNYIGFSQGGGMFYIMCSERPGACDKVNLMIGLAPATRLYHTKSRPIRLITEMVNVLEPDLRASGVNEVLEIGSPVQKLLQMICDMSPDGWCSLIEAVSDANNPGSITDATNRIMSTHFPAGTSLKNIAKWGQSTKSQQFQKFNYTKAKNVQLYGSENPPKYNFRAVTVPVLVIYGKNDHIVDPKDVKWFTRILPNLLELYAVNDSYWDHTDYTWSQKSKQLIFPKINEYLAQYSD